MRWNITIKIQYWAPYNKMENCNKMEYCDKMQYHLFVSTLRTSTIMQFEQDAPFMKTLGCNPEIECQVRNDHIAKISVIVAQLTRKNFGLNVTWCLPSPSLAAANNEDHDADKDPDKGNEDAELPHVPDQVRAHLLLGIHVLLFSVLSQLWRLQSPTVSLLGCSASEPAREGFPAEEALCVASVAQNISPNIAQILHKYLPSENIPDQRIWVKWNQKTPLQKYCKMQLNRCWKEVD